jgi:hypothetical protein
VVDGEDGVGLAVDELLDGGGDRHAPESRARGERYNGDRA